MSASTSLFSRQVRTATGSLRGHVSRAGGSSGRSRVGQARHASSSSSSSSSPMSSQYKYAAMPVAVLASVAVWSIYTSGKKPLSLETTKRKEYWERMKVEERKQQEKKAEVEQKDEKADEPEESSSKDDSKSDDSESKEVASEATQDLEEQASQESAFDPETNTINWDCPCLGGMAHGPCGEEFKTAFSCFVFSEAEPKGIDCVENFKAMQDCFRKHPEHYKDEIEDDEDFEQQETASSGPAEDDAQGKGNGQSGEEDEDEGVREWRKEMSKES